MTQTVLLLVLAASGCVRQPQVYDPHEGLRHPPLRIEVADASLSSGDLRLVGRVVDAEQGFPLRASIGLGRWGERSLTDSSGSFVFEARGVSGRDTFIVSRGGWDVLMMEVATLAARP